MKRQEARSPATRIHPVVMGLSACSGALMVALTAVRDLEAPIVVGIILGVAGLTALVAFVTRAR
jgi:hypothetical protein